MYLLFALCLLLLLVYYCQTYQEPFIDMNDTINKIKQPHKHINRMKRKLRKTKEHIHKTYIRPVHVNIKKFLRK